MGMLNAHARLAFAALAAAALGPHLPGQTKSSSLSSAVRTPRSADRITLVVPAGADLSAGNVDLLWPMVAPAPVRYQQWFHNGLFPQGKLRITGMSFRPNPQAGGKMKATNTSMLIRFSSTTNASTAPDLRFADNLSEDVTTVRSGSLELSSDFKQLDTGAMDFDVKVPFDTPFEFDTTTGRHLIIDMFNEFGTSPDGVPPLCLVPPADGPRGCNLDAQSFENADTATLRRWRSGAGNGTLAENAVPEVSDARGYVIRFECEFTPPPPAAPLGSRERARQAHILP